MYVREFGYEIVAGQEETAAALCRQFVKMLCERGIRAHVLAGNKRASTLLVAEEYHSLDSLRCAQAALECDENYRGAVCAWAAEFYPLVQAARPAVVTRQQLAA